MIYLKYIAAAAIFLAAWTIQGWRYDAVISEMKKDAAEATTKAVKEALSKTELEQKRKDDALEEATRRNQKIMAFARGLDGDINRVRDELATARADLSKANIEAVRTYSAAQSVVLGEATARLTELANYADQCASDLKLTQDAWPE